MANGQKIRHIKLEINPLTGNMAIYSKKASELPLLMILSTIVAIAFIFAYLHGGVTGAGTSCTDSDNDTYSPDGGACGLVDCNDTDPIVWQDLTGYVDSDADSYGAGSPATFCYVTLPAGYVNNSLDCNDTNPSVNPSAVEICNGIDDNCDGIVDEGCNCTEGQTEPFYTGQNGTEGIGTCHFGTRTCVSGNWNITIPEVTPQTEVCNGIDNDCDGVVNEGCNCTNGQNETVYTGPSGTQDVGICHGGTKICANGHWNTTSSEIIPQTEVCGDSIDNNCDGQVDEFCGTVLGDVDDIDSNANLKIYVGSESNISKSFGGVQIVKFKTTNNKLLIQFSYNFTSSTLDLTDVRLDINELSDRGSLLVSGLPLVNKTIFVDAIADSGKVCVKDAEVLNISSFTTNCTSLSEVKLSCPGTSGDISCDISDSRYEISGLTHSAAVELPANQTTSVVTNTTNKTIPKYVPPNATATAAPVTDTSTLPGAGATVTSTSSTKKISSTQIVAIVTAAIAAAMFLTTRVRAKPKQPQRKQPQYPKYYYNYYTGQWQYYYPQQQYPQYPQQQYQQPQQQNPQQYPQQYQQQPQQQPQWPQQYPQQPQYPQNNQQYYWPY